MPGGEETLHAIIRRGKNGINRRRHQDMGNEKREILKIFPECLQNSHSVGWGGGLESDGEEDNFRGPYFHGRF